MQSSSSHGQLIALQGIEFSKIDLSKRGNQALCLLKSELSPIDKQQLIEQAEKILRRPAKTRYGEDQLDVIDSNPVKLGRGSVERARLSSGSVILRKYLRGGVPAKFIRDTFFSTPLRSLWESRPVRELSIHSFLSASGVDVPEPVGCMAEKAWGGFGERGVIISREEVGSVNLLSLVRGDKQLAYNVGEIVFGVGRLVAKLCKLSVILPDLHLGNVLVRSSGEVILIDFDKGWFAPHGVGRDELVSRYADRFSRSVLRHCQVPGRDVELMTHFHRGLSV